jgi:hypothetical protein
MQSKRGREGRTSRVDRYNDRLDSCDLQFGFKRGRSTTMCSMIVKEVIAHYDSHDSNVYCVFIDASKAFDKVASDKLFKFLLDRHLPSQIIRLLNIYTGQQIRVLWNGTYSHSFLVSNGIKQGAILSPILFCVYIDVLLLALKKDETRCFIGHLFVAALAYADDVLLLAPTRRALRHMLSICENFAADYNVTFNCNKSKSITMHAHKYIRAGKSDPTFAISGKTIENVDTWSHLGHLFNASLTDDDDIMARRNSFVG